MALKDPVARKAYEKRYRETNRDLLRLKSRAYGKRRYATKRQEVLEKCRNWRAAHPEAIRRRDLRRFNLTIEQYEALLKKQGGACAICGKAETRTVKGKVTNLAVDHDSSCCPGTGRSCGKCVRGLLCYYCNTAIGLLRDDLTLFESAMFYLTRGKVIRSQLEKAA